MYDQMTAIAILLISFTVLLLLRFPVALTLVGSSLLTMIYIDRPLIVIGQQMMTGSTEYGLLAIPFFILTGQILGEGGLATRIVNFCLLLVGRIRGGLALVNSVACMFFGNLSGSAVADASAIGSVMIPMMKSKGYDADYSVGVTISSAIQGVVVPPSHNLVLYSIAVGGVSISALFLAGIVPGFLLLGSLMTCGYIIAVKRGYQKADPVPREQWGGIIIHGLFSLTPAVVILGGIITGWCTPTEAGAIAVTYSFILAFLIYRERPISAMWPVLRRTFRTVLMVFFLIAASNAFGYVMAVLDLPHVITEWFLAISDKPWVILLLINILLLALGGPMDMAPMILILSPILLPVCQTLGMDTIQFGIMMILNSGLGLLTPPVGTVLFVGCAIGKVSVEAGTKAMMPFFLAMCVILVMITYIPALSTWLPSLFNL